MTDEKNLDFFHEIIKNMSRVNKVFHGAISVALTGIVLGAIVVGGYGYRQLSITAQEQKKQFELLNMNFIEQNKQIVLLKVVDANLKDSTIDQKVKLTKTIYDLCTLKQIPINVICGIIEHESRWTPGVRNESSGATGLMQLIPRYAYPYMRGIGIKEDPELLKDPVYNVMIGISELADAHADFVSSGKVKDDDFTITLHSYAWGKSATYELFRRTDQKVNVPNLAYPAAILKMAKRYEQMGL